MVFESNGYHPRGPKAAINLQGERLTVMVFESNGYGVGE
jgi:hypothetical protein